MALMIAVFCCASETVCAWRSFSAALSAEAGAIVCVGFCTGAVEQPKANRRTPNIQHPTPNVQVLFITASSLINLAKVRTNLRKVSPM